MTDRVHALTVHLERDYRDDDVEAIMDAIGQLRGVGSVEKHVTAGPDIAARARLRSDVLISLICAVSAIVGEGLSIPEEWKK